MTQPSTGPPQIRRRQPRHTELRSQISRSPMSIRNVKRRLRVTLRLQVPLRSPFSVCTFHVGSERNSSGSCMST